jgi:hypothetical protein
MRHPILARLMCRASAGMYCALGRRSKARVRATLRALGEMRRVFARELRALSEALGVEWGV